MVDQILVGPVRLPFLLSLLRLYNAKSERVVSQILITSFCARLGAFSKLPYRKSLPAFSSGAFVGNLLIRTDLLHVLGVLESPKQVDYFLFL